MQAPYDEWTAVIGLDGQDYGMHSLRQTKASTVYEATGILRPVHILLGCSKIENTVRYLDVGTDDAPVLAERIEI